MSVPIKTEEVIVENAEYNSAEEFEEDLQLQLEDSGGESSYIQNVTVTPHHQRRQQNSNMNISGTAGKSSSHSGGIGTNKSMLDSEKRMRREIANSNERRRMQSINAGFQNLRSLLPRHEGDKLSKASILQQTSQYICELEDEKAQLIAQNNELKRQLGQQDSNDTINGSGGGGGGITTNSSETVSGVSIKKRKLTDNVMNVQTISDSSDEGLGSMSPEPMTLLSGGTGTTKAQVLNNTNNLIATSAKELREVKKQLDKERRLRTLLQEELQTIKRQLYSVATAPVSSSELTGTSYIPREVIEHTDNLMHESIEEIGPVSYVEINEMTGQQQVVICSSIEELESETAAAADIITEETIHEEVILSSTSSTESEQEVNVNAIAKAYAQGTSPTAAVLQPILQAAIKAQPKVEVERINEALARVKTEKIEQPHNATRSRQNLETIVEAIRHLEGDHLFGDMAEQQKLHKSQDMPLALTTKQQQAAVTAQRATLAELRPFLQLKGNKQVTIVGGPGGSAVTLTSKIAPMSVLHKEIGSTATPTALYKVQTSNNSLGTTGSTSGSSGQEVTITTSALKQCRPGVIVAKQLS